MKSNIFYVLLASTFLITKELPVSHESCLSLINLIQFGLDFLAKTFGINALLKRLLALFF